MTAKRLEPRTTPTQLRASKTVDLILTTAAELLEEIGFEELTTNKICKAAGLTPPALYRYFPNKYAVVNELARQLMERQNEALLEQSQTKEGLRLNAEQSAAILADQVRITRAFKGGVAVLKTLYATPQLSEIRLASHATVTDQITEGLFALDGRVNKDELRRRVRLMVEVGNSVIEMVVENPQMDQAAILRDTADMMVFLLSK